MTESRQTFDTILAKFTEMYSEVSTGKMMRSEAITFRGKVFCFFHEGEMAFKLGKDTDTDRPELNGWRWLSPFKNKPPMKAWYFVPYTSLHAWEQLTEESFQKICQEIS